MCPLAMRKLLLWLRRVGSGAQHSDRVFVSLEVLIIVLQQGMGFYNTCVPDEEPCHRF